MSKTVDKVLGSISPLYGAVSGRGLFGKGLAAVGDALGDYAGVLPTAASAANRRRKRKADGTEEEATPAMRKGGKIKDTNEGLKRYGDGAKALRRRKYAKGGSVMSIKDAVHKYERNMHVNKPLTKMAKGGAAKRADGAAKKGHTKGRMR